jgi:ABC-type transport system involved in multi-copper enzyme maturation permease subunit
MNPLLVFDVVRFELKRSMTVGRTAMWFLLVGFPIALFAILRQIVPPDQIEQLHQISIQDQAEQWGVMLYFLVPEVICLLGLLLWAAPAISTEIEGQTWIYLALRRSGRSWVPLGKYLTSVVWTFSAALVSCTGCVILMGPMGSFRLWGVMIVLSLLSCIAHAALYLLIGLIFYRRTMVTAVAYTLLIEYGLSFVPALANKLTINYRLRGLLAEWMDWEVARSIAENVMGREPPATHLLVLAAMTLALLGIAIFRMGHSEFPTQQEG